MIIKTSWANGLSPVWEVALLDEMLEKSPDTKSKAQVNVHSKLEMISNFWRVEWATVLQKAQRPKGFASIISAHCVHNGCGKHWIRACNPTSIDGKSDL